MKAGKICGLSTLMALAVMISALAASSASATALCEDEIFEAACAFPYSEGTTLSAGSTQTIFLNNLANVSCSESEVSLSPTQPPTEKAKALSGKISALTFASCTAGKAACTVVAERLPFTTSLSWSAGADGTFEVTNGTGGNPAVQIKCGAAISCIYNVKSAFMLRGGEAGQASLEISGQSLSKESGFLCPGGAKWDALYTFTSPSEGAAYVAAYQEPKTVLCTERSTPCPAGVPPGGSTWPVPSEIKAELGGLNAEFSFEFGEVAKLVKCTSSKIELKTSLELVPLIGLLEKLTFSGCDNGCTVTASRLPYKFYLEAARRPNGNGQVTVQATTGEEPPLITIECPGPITCKYSALLVPWTLIGSVTPTFEVNKELFTAGGPECSNEMTWQASYEVIAPTPLYVERVS